MCRQSRFHGSSSVIEPPLLRCCPKRMSSSRSEVGWRTSLDSMSALVLIEDLVSYDQNVDGPCIPALRAARSLRPFSMSASMELSLCASSCSCLSLSSRMRFTKAEGSRSSCCEADMLTNGRTNAHDSFTLHMWRDSKFLQGAV